MVLDIVKQILLGGFTMTAIINFINTEFNLTNKDLKIGFEECVVFVGFITSAIFFLTSLPRM